MGRHRGAVGVMESNYSLYIGPEPPMDSTGSNVEPSAWDHNLALVEVINRLSGAITKVATLSNEELHIVVGYHGERDENVMAMNLERESNVQARDDLETRLIDYVDRIHQELERMFDDTASDAGLTALETRVRELERAIVMTETRVTCKDLIIDAQGLLEPFDENRGGEYARGICELIAMAFGVPGVFTGDRASEIERSIFDHTHTRDDHESDPNIMAMDLERESELQGEVRALEVQVEELERRITDLENPA